MVSYGYVQQHSTQYEENHSTQYTHKFESTHPKRVYLHSKFQVMVHTQITQIKLVLLKLSVTLGSKIGHTATCGGWWLKEIPQRVSANIVTEITYKERVAEDKSADIGVATVFPAF